MMKQLLNKIFLHPTTNIWLQLFRYGFVAGGAFVMDYGFYFLCSWVLSMPYMGAAVVGFIMGTSTNYLISKYLVFIGQPKSRVGEIALVFIISGVGLMILEIGLYLFTEYCGIHYLVSKLIMTVIVFMWNFFARKFFMYSKFFNILK